MNDFKLGEHEQAIQTLLAGQERLETAVQEIKLILAEKKGERRVVLGVAGVAGTVAASLVTLLIGLVRALLKH